MTDERLEQVPFAAHVELLRCFLAHRAEVVERIEGLLNAQRKPIQYQQDRALLASHIEDAFFALAAVTDDRAQLRGQLEEAHWASGFRPRHVAELHNDLIHPAEMMRRAFYCWQQTRWPGRNGRVRYAHTLFNLYVLRSLELLSMRVWDAGASDAGDRLRTIQGVLDELWQGAPGDQPVLLRDARWLIPLAQSPTTDELAGYFEVAQRVAESFADEDRIEIQKAHALMIGGHLRSQIRHYCLQDGVPLDERSVVLRTRTSNALDFALLIQNLVPLLEAYDRACRSGDLETRVALADAFCQSVSPDPELFLDRIDLLGAYSMIERLFAAANPEGGVDYSPLGRRHVRLLREYEALIVRLAAALYDDCVRFRPVEGAYSPYGVFYGTPSNLTEHIAFKTIQRDAVTELGLEDVFSAGDAAKIDWVNGWRRLPHVDPEVQKLHEYPHEFAEEIFGRIERALHLRASGGANRDDRRTGRLFIVTDADPADPEASLVSELGPEHVGSSDRQIVAAGKAGFYDETKLLRDRQEGHFVVSYETAGGWVAIKKDMLTEVVGAGRDAKLVGLPPAAAAVARLTCASIVAGEDLHSRCQASAPPSIVKA